MDRAHQRCGSGDRHPYSKLIAGLAKAKVAIDRKILSDLALSDPNAFKKVVECRAA